MGALNELALFAGAGGGILGGHLLGWRTVCAVEIDPYAASVLVARQNDCILPPFPVWDDVCTFDGRPWRGIVDVVSGGFPCQDISAAGKGAGLDGDRSGLWSEMARIIGEVRPQYAFIENSPVLASRGLDRVLADLAALGFDAEWDVVSAANVGAPHRRERIWILAHAQYDRVSVGRGTSTACAESGNARRIFNDESSRREQQTGEILAYPDSLRESQPQGGECAEWGWIGDESNDVANANGRRRAQPEGRQMEQPRGAEIIGASNAANTHGAHVQGPQQPIGTSQAHAGFSGIRWWDSEPDVGRVANGVAGRVVRLKAIGNGQVPAVAATAWRLLHERIGT